MSVVKIVCVDNIESVNEGQLQYFYDLLDSINQKETFKELFALKKTSDESIEIEFKSEKSIKVNIFNTIVCEDDTGAINYSEKANQLINTYYNETDDGLMFIVDACLDRSNVDLMTGVAMIDAIKEQSTDKSIKVVACTGVNELDRIDWSKWSDSLLLHRRLTGENKMSLKFPAFDYSPKKHELKKIKDKALNCFLNQLLSEDQKNRQYLGEILFEALLLTSEG